MRRLVLVIALVVPIAVVPPAAAAKKKPTCTAKGAKTVAKNRSARVFTVRGGPDPDTRRRLFGCLNSTGRRVLLSIDFDDGLGLAYNFSQVKLNGRFTAWQFDQFDDTCKADCPPGYNPLHQTINIADLKTRQKKKFTGGAKEGSLAITRGGTATWLDASTGEPRSAAFR